MKNRLGNNVKGMGTRRVRTVAQRGGGESRPRGGPEVIETPEMRTDRRAKRKALVAAVMAQPSQKRERARKARRAAEREAAGGTGTDHLPRSHRPIVFHSAVDIQWVRDEAGRAG